MRYTIIKNVDTFKVFEDELFYNSNNCLCNPGHIIYQSKTKLWGQIISKHLFFIKDDEVRGIINLKEGIDVIDFPKDLNIINGTYDILTNIIIGGRIVKDMILSFAKIDLKTFHIDSLKFEFDYSFPIIAKELYIFQKNSDIFCFKEYTETTLWQYSVAELGADKVSRILGVFGQVLVVVCEMPKSTKSILVGLDITDGSKLFTVPLTQYQMNNNLFFYEANNSIVSIIGEYLWEFSLSTFQVIREKYLPEVFKTEDVHIQVYLATLQGDYIYFAASEFGKSMSSAIVGIFDLKKELLIDYIDLKPNGKFCMGGNSRPQVSGNKIYVLDTKKTLHILERENG
jgi:hypothetical protein